jgi:hypothetical protein
MKRFLIALCIVTCFTISTAQTPQPASGPSLTTDQQKSLKDAVGVFNQANSELAAAQAKAELARQQFLTLLYGVMAERGIKPSEYGWKITEQGIVFEAKPKEEAKRQ